MLMSAVACTSPDAEEQAEDGLHIAQQIDSLSTSGGHGYYVATYLIGRYKTMRVKKATFDIQVSRLDKRLVVKPIVFRVLGPLNYELSYAFGSHESKFVGEFNKPLDVELLEILVSPPQGLESAAYDRVISNSSDSDYELRVYAY